MDISGATAAKVHAWLDKVQLSLLGHMPLTGSFDVRDSTFPNRSVIVDSNRFPAGFQYISARDVSRGSELIGRGIRRCCVKPKHVHVFTEAHTRLVHYQDNVAAIKTLIQGGLPHSTVTSSSSSMAQANYTILNADLSDPEQIEDAEANVGVAQTCMGWHRRSKGVNIALMSPWIRVLARFLNLPPSTFEASWGLSASPCHLEDPTHARALATLICSFDSMADGSGAFVKNACGTYGLGVTWIPPGPFDTILAHLTRRNLDKMTYARHGQRADRFVVQEGVPTCLFSRDGSALEVVVMCLDGEYCSYFVRKGPPKTQKETVGNLNSPGATFVTRDEFESDVNFAEAAAIVQSRLPLYHILGRIGMITMAQEQLFYENQIDSSCPSLLPTCSLPTVSLPTVAQLGTPISHTRSPDREKEFRMMLSDAMHQPFQNRLAKQRFAQEANKIRKTVLKQGGSKDDFARHLAQLSNIGPVSVLSSPDATSVEIPAKMADVGVVARKHVQGDTLMGTRTAQVDTAEGARNPVQVDTAGGARNPVEVDTAGGVQADTAGGARNPVQVDTAVSGSMKHDVDLLLRKALTAFLQEVPAATRKELARKAQTAKREILDNLCADSIASERVAHFVSILNTMK